MQHILNYLQTRQDRFLVDLAALVNCDCGTYNKAGVDAVGAVMRRHLEDLGCSIETIPLQAYGDCLVGHLTGRGQARIMLIGHLDTVYPDGTVAERPMCVESGRVIGPGVNDMKAGLLAGVYALQALRSVSFDDFAEIVFFCNSDEEIGSPVSNTLYADLARQSDVVLVLESARSDGALVSARKGGGSFHLTVSGRAAHAGVEPEQGANAVLALASYIKQLHALNHIRPGVTVNVGLVHGGVRSNVVPDLAEAAIDFRVARSSDVPIVNAAFQDVVAVKHVHGTAAELRGGIESYPMEKTPAVALLAELARSVAGQLGFALEDVSSGGTSDANFVAALGTPVLDGLGPVGGLGHSSDEYLDLVSIVPRTALLAGLIEAIVRERDTIQSLRRSSG